MATKTSNYDAIYNLLESHRKAGQTGGAGWTPEAVTNALLALLELDATAAAKNAPPVVPPGITEDEVRALEAAAKDAETKAKDARAALDARTKAADGAAEKTAEDVAAENSRFVPGHPAPLHVSPIQQHEPTPAVAASPVPVLP